MTDFEGNRIKIIRITKNYRHNEQVKKRIPAIFHYLYV